MTRTPGPWKAYALVHGATDEPLTKLNKWHVAEANPPNPLEPHSITNAGGMSEADARLIAAAPDYDDAAQCYVRWVEAFKDKIAPDVLSAMECAFGGKLRAAIAKTTGE